MSQDFSEKTIFDRSRTPIPFNHATGDDYQVIDVRSAAEYEAGTVPGAINIPLFDEDERSVIGTIYRHGGQKQAIDQGFSFVERKLTDLVAAFQPFRHKRIAVFCARGGMRSLSVVNLLNQSGYSAIQLAGGYKKYRQGVLATLQQFAPRLIVLHGLTGTGKTRILQRLSPAIDLEDLAGHRSSLFGALNQRPSNQRTFESRLAGLIPSLGAEPYFIEGESRKIGRVFIPGPLAASMQKALMVRINCSLDTRIRRIIEDYPVADEAMRRQVETILRSLKQKMGASLVDRMCLLLNRGELAELVRILLLDYYDKRYGKSMSNYSYVLELSSEDIDQAAAELGRFRQSLT